MWVGKTPRRVISSMNRVYEAVRVAIPVKTIVGVNQLNSAIIMVNSAFRFVVGRESCVCEVSFNTSFG